MTNMTKKRVQLNLYLVVTYREWQGDCLIQVPQNRGIHDKKKNFLKNDTSCHNCPINLLKNTTNINFWI